MTDRGIIKWQPFNSCFNSNDILEDIKRKKQLVRFPILSEDQLNVLENKIKMAYNLKLFINIEYYYDGKIKNLNGKINYFDYYSKKLIINKKEIYFNQILKIKELN